MQPSPAGLREVSAALSISLNSTQDDQRAWLMPIHRRTSLEALQQTLISYRPRANFALGVNYCLLPGINDTREDAHRIAAFCRPLGRVLVNVIPYNPGNHPIAPAPSDVLVDAFVEWLREEGTPVRRRIVKGRSVMAACGQLGNAELRTQTRLRRRSIHVVAEPESIANRNAPARTAEPAAGTKGHGLRRSE
jgi:23S rRNA (adenine2503-C2)-methyltransferase